MEENNACAPTGVFPRIEDCCDARDGLGKEYGRGGAHVSAQSQTARGLERRVASERRAGVSWQGCSPAAEAAVNGLCQAAGVSRAGYYRFLRRPQRKEADMDLRSRIQGIALHWPAYGYRRVQVELRKQGWEVNHKRVLRLMRADNLLCLRRRKFILTTDSKHGLRIYPNLAKDMVLTRINQLWVADITYIRLQVEFVYLAVLLDAFSRRCIG